MSTSCNLILQNSEKSSIFYKNFDGYPDGAFRVVNILENFALYELAQCKYENFGSIENALVNEYGFVKVERISSFIEYLYVFDEDNREYITFKYQVEFSNDY